MKKMQGESPFERRSIDEEEVSGILTWMRAQDERTIAEHIAWQRREAALARTDVLTGLRNLRGLIEVIDHEKAIATREGQFVLVTALDLDDLKKINDKKGHQEGDKFLVNSALKIQKAVREADLVARRGGDEFVIVSRVKNEVHSKIIKLNLKRKLGKVGFSIGHATWVTGEDFTKTLDRADRLMYKDKEDRKKNAK